MLTDEIYDNGGFTDLFIATNGIDLSANSVPFRFRLTPVITSLDPTWLLVNRVGVITLYGLNFHDNDNKGGQYVILSPLDDASRNVSSNVTYINDTAVSFPWPNLASDGKTVF